MFAIFPSTHIHRALKKNADFLFFSFSLWAYSYNDTTLEDPINKFAVDMRSTFSTHNGFGDLEVYVSYAHGDEGAKIWWAENVPTLKNLKAIWDPKKLFNYMNPL